MFSCISDVTKASIKIKTTPVDPTKKIASKRPKSMSGLTLLEQKLNDLYGHILEYTDTNGRELAAPFIRLPTKNVGRMYIRFNIKVLFTPFYLLPETFNQSQTEKFQNTH